MRTFYFRVSTHQFVSGGVKGIDTEHEEGFVSEAVCLSLHSFDLVIGPFQWSGGDPMVVVREDSPAVGSQSLGKVFEYSDSRYLGSFNPALQMGLGASLVR